MNSKVFLTLCCLTLAGACTSTPKTPRQQSPQKTSTWDHEQVRKARANEKEQDALRPAPSLEAETTLDCVIMSSAQKTRSRASGCRKLDPRLGHGQDAYCCEN
jgi:hypothetical protein